MKLNSFQYLLLPICILLLFSCGNISNFKNDDSLYTGSTVEIADTFVPKKQKELLEEELATYVRPQPNSSLFGIRYRVWIWNLAGEPKKEKGIRNWLRNKIGEKPVMISEFRTQANNIILENQLFNKGFFHATADGRKITNKKKNKTKVVFPVNTGPQYFFKEINAFPNDTTALANLLRANIEKGYFTPGNPYNLDFIKAEYIRLGTIANNNGFYFFNSDYIQMYVDTASSVPYGLDIRLELKKNIIPPGAYQSFTINNIYIHSNFRNTTNSSSQNTNRFRSTDSLKYPEFTVIDRRKSIRKVVFEKSIVYKSGQIYRDVEQGKTLKRLVGTDLFKFVKSEFVVVKDSTAPTNPVVAMVYDNLLQRGLIQSPNPRLNVIYYLTQYQKKSTDVEIGGYTLNDSRVGSRINVFWKNRNFFKGAEVFSLRGSGGFEVQYGGENRRPNTYNLGAKAQLTIPRFLVPFPIKKQSSEFLPKTVFELDYNLYLRSGLYRINSFSTHLGYMWKENIQKEHRLNPLNITYVKTDTISTNNDVRFQNIIFNGVIIGPTYEYIYNSQVANNNRHKFYFAGMADFSGNILGISQNADYYENKKTIFGNPYSQYVKLQTDFRHYYTLDRSSSIASRLFLGMGLPYGNSVVLPNIKQFFAGGISSLRGFNSRMVGPGTYNERYLTGNSTYIEMLGDVKVELNAEYRKQIYDMFHGAVFVDAGNVWLKNENSAFPGGHFTKNFYKELAVSAGLGLRIDISILLIRLDLGMPIRKPWLPEGERWVFNQIDFGSPVWRKQNLVFGFAIGYPF